MKKLLENSGHSGTKSETYSRGLQYIFERSKVSFDTKLPDKYASIETVFTQQQNF